MSQSEETLRRLERSFAIDFAPFIRAADDPDGRELALCFYNYVKKKRQQAYRSRAAAEAALPIG